MITILIPSLAMMTGYFGWYQMKTETKTKAFKNAEKSSDFLGHFLESTYLLYNTCLLYTSTKKKKSSPCVNSCHTASVKTT